MAEMENDPELEKDSPNPKERAAAVTVARAERHHPVDGELPARLEGEGRLRRLRVSQSQPASR